MPSAAVQPKQILKRAPSQKEYEFLQEWAPETLKNYEVPSQQTVLRPPQAAPVKEQGIPTHRHSRLRTSSLYEDWKAHAASSQGENANKECTPSPHAPAQKVDHLPHPASLTAATVAAEKPIHCLQSRTNAKGSQQVCSKSNTLHPHHYAQSTVSASNRFNTIHAGDRKLSKSVADPANTLKPTEPTKKAVESRQKPRTGSVCYTAPNGTRFPRHNDLLKWSIGVKNQHNDLVIFLPVFVESPWKGLKPILTTCASRY
ncbi:uncharacterized protein BO66DRAFT_386026 [Aspergillus aculeatinus CBS 121060]|uniref:Uncharacterized protein n=1 Tax=Aspergillus aculeatinus CBS 121060 TaxID=1448322 RepID=A0ACD1GSS5_9EURO|nr:hypothetical protein BO66DRAFT_386026 [Aspergillus aculeatinus CBS 121060]RAH64182.1 hypothetical protein BO66DRAFT_386026 [Aspergillus aculeatinus CBS 121060]